MPLLNARYRPGCCDQACAYSTDVVVFAQPANAIHFRVRVGGCARISSCSRVSGWPLTPMRPAELFRVCPMGIQWEQNRASSKEVSGSFELVACEDEIALEIGRVSCGERGGHNM